LQHIEDTGRGEGEVNLIRTICNIATAVSMMYIIGLAGASDADAISIKQLMIRGTVSTAIFAISVIVAQRKGA